MQELDSRPTSSGAKQLLQKLMSLLWPHPCFLNGDLAESILQGVNNRLTVPRQNCNERSPVAKHHIVCQSAAWTQRIHARVSAKRQDRPNCLPLWPEPSVGADPNRSSCFGTEANEGNKGRKCDGVIVDEFVRIRGLCDSSNSDESGDSCDSFVLFVDFCSERGLPSIEVNLDGFEGTGDLWRKALEDRYTGSSRPGRFSW